MIAVVLIMPGNATAQGKTTINGKVTDNHGTPLSFANVFIKNSTDGAMTDPEGVFTFFTKLKGECLLTASIIGYKTFNQKINMDTLKDFMFLITLEEKSVSLREAIVTASSYGSEKEKGLVISRIDVLTTPGGAADIFQALKTMPGLTQVSESAELFVRGGDPLETTTIIDQAVVYHPFTFESGYGGLFSNINPSVVKSLYFTSGGFSAKYGNALSGVLDIETRNVPGSRVVNVGLSMANASITAEIPFVEDKSGVYFDYRQNYTQPIFWLNGGLDRFTQIPVSKSATGAVVFSYSKTGKIKLFGAYADDREGVNVERAEYNGIFNGDSKNLYFNLQNSSIMSDNLLMKNSLSFDRFINNWKIGIVDLTKTDYVYGFRNDLEYTLNSQSKLLFGFETELRKYVYDGKISNSDFDIRPGAESKILEATLKANRWGAYSEYQSLNTLDIKDLTFTGGVRFDQFPTLNLSWIDPRFSLGYKLTEKSNLRFGWGIFHQIPDPRLFAPVDGNPDLQASRAVHYIASYDYAIDDMNSFRIELYHKKYDNLPLEKPVINYDNSGYGFANGVDVIFKGSLPFDITGWISYGFINTKRLWMDYTELSNSSYDITHNFTIVAKYNLSTYLQLGLNAKYATGRPYTPVQSAIYHKEQSIFEPLYAGTNSDRFPDYKRVDLRLTYFGQFYNSFPLVAYVEALNILNIQNIFGYSYSPDYTERKTIKSYFGSRMIVIGFSMTIN